MHQNVNVIGAFETPKGSFSVHVPFETDPMPMAFSIILFSSQSRKLFATTVRATTMHEYP